MGKVSIFIMGKRYNVPEGSTIITALEYAGFQLKRGCGCREGFCGACSTVYRLPGDYKLRTGLACGTVVEKDMQLVQIPFVPAEKVIYDISKLTPSVDVFQKLYPEVFRCLSCNTCTKACPQNIEVMDYIQAIIKGDIEKAADISFDCIMCGLCAMRCPAEIVQYQVGLLARRLYGKYLSPKGEFIKTRVKEIEDHKYDKELSELSSMSKDEVSKRYYARDLDFKIT
ncbi:MAG: 4Fe-4S dicluster domain-containing protein [bacterium]|nr:4Fe-4S dicluster domain-containing protein [bacterium]